MYATRHVERIFLKSNITYMPTLYNYKTCSNSTSPLLYPSVANPTQYSNPQRLNFMLHGAFNLTCRTFLIRPHAFYAVLEKLTKKKKNNNAISILKKNAHFSLVNPCQGSIIEA